MKITIIGAGNTAVAAACFLKTLGLSSLIYTRREERAKQCRLSQIFLSIYREKRPAAKRFPPLPAVPGDSSHRP